MYESRIKSPELDLDVDYIIGAHTIPSRAVIFFITYKSSGLQVNLSISNQLKHYFTERGQG